MTYLKPSMFKRARPLGAAAATVFAMSLAINSATAQDNDTCGALESASLGNQGQMAQLLVDYPGTSVVIGLCGEAAKDNYERTSDPSSTFGTFMVCAGLGCAFAGFDNCGYVAKRWMLLWLKDMTIDHRRKELGCP